MHDKWTTRYGISSRIQCREGLMATCTTQDYKFRVPCAKPLVKDSHNCLMGKKHSTMCSKSCAAHIHMHPVMGSAQLWSCCNSHACTSRVSEDKATKSVQTRALIQAQKLTISRGRVCLRHQMSWRHPCSVEGAEHTTQCFPCAPAIHNYSQLNGRYILDSCLWYIPFQ